jgi:oligosaccharide translocation protein RFT1
MAAIGSFSDFGLYQLVSTYSEFIASRSFNIINYSNRKLFARMHTPAEASTNGEPNHRARFARIRLQNILQLYSVFSILAATAGPAMAPMLLQMIAGSNWAGSEAGSFISSYCYYIPLMAIAGLTESFVDSVATQSELATKRRFMATSLLVFAGAAYTFVKILGLGANGLIYASCVRTLFLISFNYSFCARYLQQRGQVSTLQTVTRSLVHFITRTLIFPRSYHVLGRSY